MNSIQKALIDNKSLTYKQRLEKIIPCLKSFCLSRVFNKDDALDVAQNCLVILIKKQDNYDKDRSFYSWAMTICGFQIKAYLSSKKRNKTDSLHSFCPEKGGVSEDSLAFSFNKRFASSPLNNKLKEELKVERLELINNIKNNRLTKREKKFFQLSLDGHSKDFIQKEMSYTTVNYYTTKARLIKKIKLILKCEKN